MTRIQAQGTLTASGLAAQFYARRSEAHFISAKQADFILSLLRRETHEPRETRVWFTGPDGRERLAEIQRQRNGAAYFEVRFNCPKCGTWHIDHPNAPEHYNAATGTFD